MSNIASVNSDGTTGDIEQARQQVDQAALARSHTTDNGNGFSGRDRKRNITQYGSFVRWMSITHAAARLLPVGRIGKIHVPKPDLAAHRVRTPTRTVPRAVDEVGPGLPDHLQSLHGGFAALIQGDQPAHGHGRPGQQVKIAHKRHQVAQTELAGYDL